MGIVLLLLCWDINMKNNRPCPLLNIRLLVCVSSLEVLVVKYMLQIN